jgi:hypothetical protein
MRNWIELDEKACRATWDAVTEAFRFLPSTDPADWPSLREPEASVTYSLQRLWRDPARHERLRRDAESKVLAALRAVTAPDEWLFALDWQHPGFRFFPHLPFEAGPDDEWPVPLLPDGDYYFFVEPALRFGWLGHPWEKTACVFGADFLAALARDPVLLLDHPVRRGGRWIQP